MTAGYPGTVEEGALKRHAVAVARALNAVGERAGKPFTMRTQQGRFRIQKTVYLLKLTGFPSAQRFDFNIYQMGPYSPDLARAYYLLEDDGIRSAGSTSEIPAPTLATIAEALGRSHQFLEGLTTFLDIRLQTGQGGPALAQARAIKSHIDEPTWKEVRVFLQAHPDLLSST